LAYPVMFLAPTPTRRAVWREMDATARTEFAVRLPISRTTAMAPTTVPLARNAGTSPTAVSTKRNALQLSPAASTARYAIHCLLPAIVVAVESSTRVSSRRSLTMVVARRLGGILANKPPTASKQPLRARAKLPKRESVLRALSNSVERALPVASILYTTQQSSPPGPSHPTSLGAPHLLTRRPWSRLGKACSWVRRTEPNLQKTFREWLPASCSAGGCRHGSAERCRSAVEQAVAADLVAARASA